MARVKHEAVQALIPGSITILLLITLHVHCIYLNLPSIDPQFIPHLPPIYPRFASILLVPAKKTALDEMRDQSSVRNAVFEFEKDPKYLELDALAQNRALLSFHEQLDQQLSTALRPPSK